MCVLSVVQESGASTHRGDAAAKPAVGRPQGPVSRGRRGAVPACAGRQREVERPAEEHRRQGGQQPPRPPPTAHYRLPTTHYPLPTAHRPLPTSPVNDVPDVSHVL